MIRASLGDQAYWDKWTAISAETIDGILNQLVVPSANPTYRAQYVWHLVTEYQSIILYRYSRGDPIGELAHHFAALLDAWELSNRLAEEICEEHHLKTARAWTFELANLNYYNWCFWLVGLALTLEIPDEQWSRLVALIDAEGQDELLDRVMATRQADRAIGTRLLHHKPYARLFKAINADKGKQPKLLREFVDNWYPELARKDKDEPWWYTYGDPTTNPIAMGNYFGRWCIEAAVVAKVFHIDDALCLGHENYPGDLLRPDGPSTHSQHPRVKPGFFKTLFGGKR